MGTQYINTVETAKIIRKILKESFPGIKFSVTSNSGDTSILVKWEDGPTQNQVNAIVRWFECAITERYIFGPDLVMIYRSYSKNFWDQVAGRTGKKPKDIMVSDDLVKLVIKELETISLCHPQHSKTYAEYRPTFYAKAA